MARRLKRNTVGDFEFGVEHGEATLLKYKGNGDKTLNVPSSIDGVPVTAIGARAMQAAKDVERVKVPDTVIDIGSDAFAMCTSLESLELGEGVEEIHSSCFQGCNSLTDINLPKSVRQIYKSAFEDCSALTEIALPDGLEVLNRFLFRGCVSLESVELPYGLRRIAAECFNGCSSLSDLYYFSKRGISDVMVTDKSLCEHTLPTMVEYIGPKAFEGGASLRHLEIPYLVRKVEASSFKGCISLQRVEFHNVVNEIGTHAFYGCIALQSVRLPLLCKKIGNEAFDPRTELVASASAYAAKYAERNGLSFRAVSTEDLESRSMMVPRGPDESHKSFYSRDELEKIVERFEMRHPSYSENEKARHVPADTTIIPSRFRLHNERYANTSGNPNSVRIMMVGDLMARYRQQVAAWTGTSYSFDFSFDFVRDLIHQSDLAIGNLESMVSPSAPTTHEVEHINARPHLNSPESFLAAIRKAGFDCVVGAQNHAYDVGVKGIIETLDSENKYQLAHTGIFASAADKRYLMFEIQGIRIALVSYFDGARQPMKKANFTKVGRASMLSLFDQEQVSSDVRNAREEGAEFVLAYCHWGREYTPEITERQRKFASWVVEAGADYIIGSHSHCLQPYEVLTGSDGRHVPCLWSAGNFLSDINLQPPITRDTVVMDLVLTRNARNRVVLKSESYHPCRIMNLAVDEGRNYAVVPTETKLGPKLNEHLTEARGRIVKVIGESLSPYDGTGEQLGKRPDRITEPVLSQNVGADEPVSTASDSFTSSATDAQETECDNRDFEDVQSLDALKEWTTEIRLRTGLSYTDSVEKLRTASQDHGIGPDEFVKQELYWLSAEKLAIPRVRDRYVELVAQRKRVGYLEAMAQMQRIRDRYGITYREYCLNKLYNYKTSKGLDEALTRIIGRENDNILQVCRETGWDFAKAESEMQAVMEKWPTITPKKYVGYGFFSMTEDEIREKIRGWNTKAKKNREIVQANTGWSQSKIKNHMARYETLYNIIPAYYVCYKAWELSDEEMDSYARQKLSERLWAKYNVRSATDVLNDKEEFDSVYRDYVNRKFWVNAGTNFDEFLAFADGLDTAFCKPVKSGGGLGTFKVDLTGSKRKLKKVYEDLMKKNRVLVEEAVVQHHEVSEFYPEAVNTVRVVVLQDENGKHIITTGIRFGDHGITDNFSADGMVCDIDIETGELITDAVNKAGEVFQSHPSSGKTFKGFRVPNWDQLLNAALDAMDVLDGVNYVGWDFAVREDDVCIIEGNSMPDLVLVQAPYAPSKVGKRYLFDPYLDAKKPKAHSGGAVIK